MKDTGVSGTSPGTKLLASSTPRSASWLSITPTAFTASSTDTLRSAARFFASSIATSAFSTPLWGKGEGKGKGEGESDLHLPPYTLHSTLYTPHPTPYTLHTPHPIPYLQLDDFLVEARRLFM